MEKICTFFRGICIVRFDRLSKEIQRYLKYKKKKKKMKEQNE
jgi:hypothetical protein